MGIPFIAQCYSEAFDFSLMEGLLGEYAAHLHITQDVYAKAKDQPSFNPTHCFEVFGHLIRWNIKASVMAGWEVTSLTASEETGEKFAYYSHRLQHLERLLDPSWTFDCPVCQEVESFVCELDDKKLEAGCIAIKRSICVNCDLTITSLWPFLADAVCSSQAASNRANILQDYGICVEE